MKEVIYLAVSRQRVERMAKSLPTLKCGEIPVKLEIVVDDAAFREPVIERRVHISDWREGLELPDPELRDGIITEAEAKVIRVQRLALMRRMLEQHGFEVTPPGGSQCPGCGSPERAEHGYVPGATGTPVSCSNEWHDEDPDA